MALPKAVLIVCKNCIKHRAKPVVAEKKARSADRAFAFL